MRKIDKIIIHCSATNSKKYDHDAIKKDHMDNRCFSDIGYHFTIDHKGNIRIGRSLYKPGAHCKGKNSQSIGICLLGLDNFTEVQFAECKKLVIMLLDMFRLGKCRVFPHNMFNSNKTCPNFDIEKVL